MNSVNMVGRLCADPELRRTGNGLAVCSYSLAVKRPMVKDVTDFFEIVSWRQSAEYLAQYGHKGDIVAVSGNLQPREWTDKNGAKHKVYEVVTSTVELIPRTKAGEGSAKSQYGSAAPEGWSQGYGGNGQDYAPISGDDAKLPF